MKMLSTVHSGDDRVQVTRNTKVNGEHVVLQLNQPKCIQDYNAHMGGVDVFDQHVAAYRSLRKTNKYWRTIALDFLDAVAVNSYILFTLSRKADPERFKRPRQYDASDFRQNLICQLAGIDDDDAVSLYKPAGKQAQAPMPPGPHVVRFTEVERSCKRCSRVDKVQRKCQSMCVTCGVHLHANHRDCFYKYHQKQN